MKMKRKFMFQYTGTRRKPSRRQAISSIRRRSEKEKKKENL